jgi:hypothetical protein
MIKHICNKIKLFYYLFIKKQLIYDINRYSTTFN